MNKELIVLGNSKSGKSVLSKWLTYPVGSFKFSEIRSSPTILATHEGENMKIYECGGKRAFDILRKTLYGKPNVSVILLCFPLDKKDGLKDISSKHIPEIERNYEGKRMPLVYLIGTKDDLSENSSIIPRDKIVKVVQKSNLACYLNVSLKTGKNMSRLKELIFSFQDILGDLNERMEYLIQSVEDYSTSKIRFRDGRSLHFFRSMLNLA